MDKDNLELFKKALNEAVNRKINKLIEECNEEIIISERHKRAMQLIIYGDIGHSKEKEDSNTKQNES